ncbi:hypothetical protein [Castellaniella sp.]|uniref:hypothetical protein n=1 Tax=Castellaniella sp. TaxID=1955812 RepID=UPI002AFFD83F|nr:hypothetical protein [Castellaniella sp.]
MTKVRGENQTYKIKESEKARVLADELVQKVIEHRDKETKELDPIEGLNRYIVDYGRGLFELKDAEIAYALIYLRKKMAETGNRALMVSYDDGVSDITQDVKLLVAKGVLTSSALAAVHHMDLVAKALSGLLD